MIDRKIEDAINQQINWELYSSYLYFSMAAYFDSVNLKGFFKLDENTGNGRAYSRKEIL